VPASKTPQRRAPEPPEIFYMHLQLHLTMFDGTTEGGI